MRRWVGGDAPYHCLYANESGRIIGETSMMGMSMKSKFVCTVYPNATDSINLGVYIDSDSAKAIIEAYWNSRDNIIDNNILENNA
jgi:hypothetical protein